MVAKLMKKLRTLFRTQEFINFFLEVAATGICSDPILNTSTSSGSTVFLVLITLYSITLIIHGRSQWRRGLRRGSAVARLLGLWVRIPPGTWMSVCCECCVLSGRGLCVGLITRTEESYRVRCV